MEVIRDITPDKFKSNVATIGFFDGVHLGHQALIHQVKTLAHKKGLRSLLITFPEHPRKVMNADYQPELLTTLRERVSRLASTGVDYCALLPFTVEMSQLSARDFMRLYLKEMMHVEVLVIGYDHHFGHNVEETFDDYKRFGEEMGMEVRQAEACDVDGECISSSSIRFDLQMGDVTKVTRCLGTPYALEATVVRGHQIGKEIGYPTANLDLTDSEKKIPANGVYAVKVCDKDQEFAGMLNIGTRPTFNNGEERTVEVNVLNYSGYLYGHSLRVEFIRRLRSEKKFDSREALIEQLQKDAERVESIIKL